MDALREAVEANFVPGVRTNHFMPSGALEREIASGGLFRSGWPGGLALFHRRDGYFRMTFYLTDLTAPFTEELPEGPVVTEIAEKPGRAAGEIAFWQEQGFLLAERRVRLMRPGDMEPLPGLWPVRTAERGDLPGVERVLRERFHPYTGCIPQGEELEELLTSGCFFAVGEGEIDGVVSLRREGSHAQLRHLAVRKELEGKGLGSALVSAISRAQVGRKTVLWTAEGDTPARRLYEKHGYWDDGWRSAVLLRAK